MVVIYADDISLSCHYEPYLGKGYHLTMVFDKPNNKSTKRPMAQEVLAVLRHSCKNAQLESAVGMEATFTLPYVDREKYYDLCVERTFL